MRTIAVFFGGTSNEHEISVITGMLAVNLLRGGENRILPVYLPLGGGMMLAEQARGVEDFKGEISYPFVDFTEGGIAPLRKPKKKIAIDCALNCCHGGAGENGTLSALFDWYKIKSASPAMAPSAVFMDKALTKIAVRGLNVPTARAFYFTEAERERFPWSEEAEKLGYPLVVKPAKLGSSIGISVVQNQEELSRAFALAFRLDSKVLVEEYLPNKRDLNCAAYLKDGEVVLSPIEEVFSSGEFLSFGEKYEGRAEQCSEIPARIPEKIKQQIKDVLRTLYTAFDFFGVVRADFILSNENLYFNELNTVPGSLSAYLYGQSLSDAHEHLNTLICEALNTDAPKKQTVTTGILNSGIFAGGKGSKRR